MISPGFNLLEFLKNLDVTDRKEIIRVGSQESFAAKDVTPKRGDKATKQKQNEYISDLRMFLEFVRYSDNGGMSWAEAFLASPQWKNTQRFRSAIQSFRGCEPGIVVTGDLHSFVGSDIK